MVTRHGADADSNWRRRTAACKLDTEPCLGLYYSSKDTIVYLRRKIYNTADMSAGRCKYAGGGRVGMEEVKAKDDLSTMS